MTQHTPGEWKEEHISADDYIITYSDGNLRSHIAWIRDGALCEEHGITKANARLITAAPELLEALRDLYALTEGLMLRDGSGPVRCTAGAMRAEQALAKAEGRG